MLALAAFMMAPVATARANLMTATEVAHSGGQPPSLPSPLVVPGVSPATTLLGYFDSSGTLTTDTQAWGDSIHCDPADLHRVYFQNLDGLRNDSDEMDLYVSSMSQFKVSTFCWADHGLNLSQVSIRQALQRPITSYFGTARTACSYSSLPPGPASLRSGFQPGGTFMATTGKWATRSTGKPITDPSGLGRWSGLCFLGKRGKKLAIFTAYRSPRQQPTGGYGFFYQQYALLL